VEEVAEKKELRKLREMGKVAVQKVKEDHQYQSMVY
jgi:hypothetical protein